MKFSRHSQFSNTFGYLLLKKTFKIDENTRHLSTEQTETLKRMNNTSNIKFLSEPNVLAEKFNVFGMFFDVFGRFRMLIHYFLVFLNDFKICFNFFCFFFEVLCIFLKFSIELFPFFTHFL